MATTRNLLRWILDSIADRGLSFRGNLSYAPIKRLCQDLVSEPGEASGTAIAREIAERYTALANGDRLKFFESLLEPNWLADPEQVLRSATQYSSQPTAAHLSKLFRLAEPKRQELFRRINMGPRGTETIVNMRRDLLALLPENPGLEPINADLIHLLSSWFNRGFLEMRRIDWRTPAIVLEKLIHYEAVHEIQGWPDLRRRLQDDRRCFAFFHPALPEEPLIFVQVALTRGLPAGIQPLLDITAEPAELSTVDTAAFYSISNCLDGLRNISFGAFLLKQVIHELETEELRLKNFVTLSPIPGFRAWLQKREPSIAGGASLAISQPEPLLRACARYLTATLPSGRAADPVTHFHLSNGASIERINWMSDKSQKGMRQSFGLMVNYSYKPARIERNHEQYVKQGRFAMSDEVAWLLKEKTPKGRPRSEHKGEQPAAPAQ
jgi:malonyl-CoA decarboxylase